MELMEYTRENPPSRASSTQSKVDYYMRAESRLSVIPKPEHEPEESRAQYAWRVVKHCVRDAIDLTMKADVLDRTISHGIQSSRKIMHAQPIQQMLFNKLTKEFITLDGQRLRVFCTDGRKKEVIEPEESFNRLVHASQLNLFIGWTYGETRVLLMNPEFEVVSSCNALGPMSSMVYNENVGECVSTGKGFITSWTFRYGGRHLLPRKITQEGLNPEDKLEHLVLEETASRHQRGFACTGKSVVTFNLYEGRVLEYKSDLHVRLITTILFFNPLKYLVTASKDGSIKVWDDRWHLQLVFVGHSAAVTSLAVYPYGPNIMSASQDNTIRVWSLETCDEVDLINTVEAPVQLGTLVNLDFFFSVTNHHAEIWKVQHIHRLHTRINQKVSLIKVTDHPEFPMRAVLVCRDASVRIASPDSGEILTTLLMPTGKGLVDAAYAVADNMLFAAFANGDIVKAYTGTNPCTEMELWPCTDKTKACNYLLVYEYVISADMATDTWGGFKRIAATRGLAPSPTVRPPSSARGGGNMSPSPSKAGGANRTLLLGGRKDGHICVFNMDSGKVEFQIEAHGSKGVLSMKANSKADQLISAGLDNIIKVWRLYPYAQESLAPLMSFYCAHLPLHMCVLRDRLAVAFQEHTSATYSIVMYNLRGKNRLDHNTEDDHDDSITGLTACNKVKMLASCSNDGTVRVWNELNNLVRIIRLNATPSSISFCSHKGDLLVGIGDHVHRIDYKTYMPKSYRFRMVAMKFPTFPEDHPLPFDEELLSKLSNDDKRRLKNARSSYKFTHFMDILTGEENEEILKERKVREEAYSKLEAREKEISQIRDGELAPHKKRKATKKTRTEAFNKYLEFFYTRNTIVLPEEKMSIGDRVLELTKDPIKKEEEEEKNEWREEQRPRGFFPGGGRVDPQFLPHPPPIPKDAPIQRDGLIPNSVLARILFPLPERGEDEVEKEYRPPVLNEQQLAELDEYSLKKFASKGLDRTLMLDWSDEEPEKDELSDRSMGGLSSDLMAKVDIQMAVEDENAAEEEKEPVVKSEESAFKIPSFEGASRASIAPKKPLQKLVAPPPDPIAKLPEVDKDEQKRRRSRLKSDSPEAPPERPTTPLPRFIDAYKDKAWFTQYFPNLTSKTMPKPWTVGAFVSMLVKILRITDYSNKVHVLEALKEIQEIEGIPCVDAVTKTLYSIFNHHTNPPSAQDPDQRQFIADAIQLLYLLGQYDKDFFVEYMVQYMETDKELRLQIRDNLNAIGLIDPHKYLPKELDSWDVWNLEEKERSTELRHMCKQWLDKWMTGFKMQLQDTIGKLKTGTALAGHATPSQLQKASASSSRKDDSRVMSVMMDRAPDQLTVDGSTYMDALNYFCEMEHEKELQKLRDGRSGDQKNTVLVLPKIQAPKGCLVRLGETHVSKCRADRETQYAVDLRLPPVTLRGKVPAPGELYGFPNCINLPLKSVDMNPFLSEKEKRELQQTPILLMLRTAQKYFVQERSVVPAPPSC